MEVNDNDLVFDFDNDSSVDGLGNEFFEKSGIEEGSEEIEKSLSYEDELGFHNVGDDNFIDYSALATSIKEATPVYQLDTDLDDLPISDVMLLIVAFLLGIMIVGGKRK